MEVMNYAIDLKIKEEIADGNDGVKRLHSCQYCCQSYSGKSHLQDHYHTAHPDEWPYNCSLCNVSFKTSSGLRRHCKKKHNMNQCLNFTCQFCGMKFQYETNLDTHYQVAHKEVTPYTCKCCHKPYKTLRTLRKHYLSMQRGKIFSCVFCQTSFAYSDNLKMHIMRRHTNERPFVCKYCAKTFVEKRQLNCHIRTHTGEKPFMCDICGCSFAEKGAMKMHVRRHTGEKPYCCQICGKLFVRSSTLARHRLIHSHEKNYKCTTCGKLFARSDKLKDHQNSHLRNK